VAGAGAELQPAASAAAQVRAAVAGARLAIREVEFTEVSLSRRGSVSRVPVMTPVPARRLRDLGTPRRDRFPAAPRPVASWSAESAPGGVFPLGVRTSWGRFLPGGNRLLGVFLSWG
jgi:hypothetical protein